MSKQDRSKKRTGSRQHWTADTAAEVLSQWKSSGLSLAAFARRQGLTAQRIAWWRDRLERPGKSASPGRSQLSAIRFVPAVVRDRAPAFVEAAVTIRLRGGGRVEVADPARVPPQWLCALLRGCGDDQP